MRTRAAKAVWAAAFSAVLLGAPNAAGAANFKVLYAFTGGKDGGAPGGALVRDKAGNLYGTASVGGSFGGDYGYGTVFRLAPDGAYAVLHAFRGGKDGIEPYAGLYRDKKGNLTGTTINGGANHAGTIFRLSADGREKVLHAFGGSGDGATPSSPLVSDGAGNLYGTTGTGGAAGTGTVFRLAADGTETVLYSFRGANDGGLPYGGVITDASGNLYGTTFEYGAHHCGTVFELAPDGSFTVLYSFAGYPTDGCEPMGSLKRSKSGDLYGTTVLDGVNEGFGTVFKLAAGGSESVLYSFQGEQDGGFPNAGLTANRSGSVLYGSTTCEGYGCSTVFKFANGALSVLHQFDPQTDGNFPVAPLIGDGAGNLYGTALEGGPYNDGTIFEVSEK